MASYKRRREDSLGEAMSGRLGWATTGLGDYYQVIYVFCAFMNLAASDVGPMAVQRRLPPALPLGRGVHPVMG